MHEHCSCVCACVRACVCACVCACVRACMCMLVISLCYTWQVKDMVPLDANEMLVVYNQEGDSIKRRIVQGRNRLLGIA